MKVLLASDLHVSNKCQIVIVCRAGGQRGPNCYVDNLSRIQSTHAYKQAGSARPTLTYVQEQ